jgi:hypothetical protein
MGWQASWRDQPSSRLRLGKQVKPGSPNSPPQRMPTAAGKLSNSETFREQAAGLSNRI